MPNEKTVAIRCNGFDALELDQLQPFQGGLKERSEEDVDAVIKSIKRFGFSFPFFVYVSRGKYYCMDGHGRLEALARLRDEEGYTVPALPVAYVEAKSMKEARQKLLRLNSQYGRMTLETVMDFAKGLEVAWDELSLPDSSRMVIDTEIDLDDWFDPESEDEGKLKPVRLCPHCGKDINQPPDEPDIQ